MVQLIKLGGSVLTDKAQDEPTVRQEVLDRLAQELAQDDHEIVLVHGAGSFGHPLAHAHGLVDGVDDPETAKGMARVHADVRRLDLAVLDALDEAGRPAVSLPPFGTLGYSDGKPGSWNLVPIHRCLSMGLTPVTFGDVVLDTTRGATVASGDQLMVELTRFLRPERALFVIDEDGIYETPPDRGGDGKPLEEVALDDLQALKEAAGGAKGADVTGGMAGKLAATQHMLRYTQEVGFVNGLADDRLAEALDGRVQGTVARKEEEP